MNGEFKPDIVIMYNFIPDFSFKLRFKKVCQKGRFLSNNLGTSLPTAGIERPRIPSLHPFTPAFYLPSSPLLFPGGSGWKPLKFRFILMTQKIQLLFAFFFFFNFIVQEFSPNQKVKKNQFKKLIISQQSESVPSNIFSAHTFRQKKKKNV